MRIYFVGVLLLLFVASCCANIQVTDPNVSFLSNLVQTNLVIRRDVRKEKGIELSVVLSGPGAPQVTVDDVLSVVGGSIEVRPKDEPLPPSAENSSALRHSTPFILSLVCIIGLIIGSRFRYVAIGAISLALVGGSIALQQFNAEWTLEVIATVPSSLSLQSLKINIAHGSVTIEDGVELSVSSSFIVDLCGGDASNFINIDGHSLYLSGTADLCAPNKVLVNNVTMTSGSLLATSEQDSAFVFIKNSDSFTSTFKVSSANGFAIATPCENRTMEQTETREMRGSCGMNNGSGLHMQVVSHFDAVLAVAEAPVRNAQRWSDPQTWGGKIPEDGEDIVIASNQVIMIDTTTASLGNLEIRGILVADPAKDFWITAESINVYGTLRVGSVSSPYTGKGIFTLTGAKGTYTPRTPLLGFSNPGTSRVLFGHPGSNLQLHGPRRAPYTRLNDHATANSTVLTLDSILGWKVGDMIAISPTTFPTTSSTDYCQIVAIDDAKNQVTIDRGLSFARWGKIQYFTDNGLSLQQGVFEKMRAHPSITDVLDERAVVIHLTRNIVVNSINDSDWLAGHGAHVMWMGPTTQVQLNGVEVHRAGQAGVLGRYAIHAHMQSYNMAGARSVSDVSDGVYVGEASGVFVRNCAVHNSVNRAFVIHGTCGARYENNVAFDILGHAFFFEDGSEVRNHFIGNVVLNVRPPTESNRILMHDKDASGVWFTNGNNHFRNNIAGDIRNGFGIWNAFSFQGTREGYAGSCLGQSRNVKLYPYYTPMLDYYNNTAFSCRQQGILSDNAVDDELGNTKSTYIMTSSDGLPNNYADRRHIPTKFENHRLWMNQGGGYGNRMSNPLYLGWLAADNTGTDISGATNLGLIANGIFVGNSLNTLEPRLKTMNRHAFATYHFQVDFVNISFFHYPPIPNPAQKTGYKLLDMNGVMTSWDLYLRSIEMGCRNSDNWLKFDCAVFERTPPPNIEQMYPNNTGGPSVDTRHHTLSGALYDHTGILGGTARTFLIFDHPFLAWNLTRKWPVVKDSRTLVSPEHFIGLMVRQDDSHTDVYTYSEALTFVRLDKDFNEVPGARWVMEDGNKAKMLQWMRHASIVKYGVYRMFNHDNSTAYETRYTVGIANGVPEHNATFILGVPWSARVRPNVRFERIAISQVSSRTLMKNNPMSFWHDRATNQVWYHHDIVAGGSLYLTANSTYA